MAKTKIRASALSASMPTDGESAAASSTLAVSDIGSTLDHMASAIKRIHGASSFTENVAGEFLVDVVVKGTTPKLTIGDAGAEDTMLVFDGNAQDYRIGLDDGTDKLELGVGSAHGTTIAMTVDASQQVAVIATTEASSITSGALTVAGGASVGKDLYVGDDLELDSDGAKLGFGADSDVSLTHVADTGLLLNSSMKLQFRDATEFVQSDQDGFMHMEGATAVHLAVGGADKAMVSASGLEVVGSITIGSAAMSESDLEQLDGITAGTAAASKAVVLDASKNIATLGTVGCGAITSTGNSGMAQLTTSGRVIVDDATDATTATDGSLQTDGGLSVAKAAYIGTDLVVIDDVTLKSDSAVLNFGADSDVNLTHVADTGLLLNSTMQLQFNDASQYINAPSATVLDINATDEIELNATLVDINGNIDASGTYTGAGLMTTGGSIIIPDAGNLGSASDPNAIAISAAGQIQVTATTEATSATDGALRSDGGLSVAKSAVIGDDLDLLSNSAILKMGVAQPFTITHANASNTATISANHRLAFGDAGDYIFGDGSDLSVESSNDLVMVAANKLVIDAQGTDSGDGVDISLGTDTANAQFPGEEQLWYCTIQC